MLAMWFTDLSTAHNAVRRPVSRLTSSTTTAITNRRWIKLPATWKLNPSSHRMSRITKIVQSISASKNLSLRINVSFYHTVLAVTEPG